jgi:hypothetical protein
VIEVGMVQLSKYMDFGLSRDLFTSVARVSQLGNIFDTTDAFMALFMQLVLDYFYI